MKTLVYLLLTLIPLSSLQVSRPITLYLIGDSTIAEKLATRRPETGWGEKLGMFFDSTVRIANHAKNGRSTKSFLAEGLWVPIMDSLRPGDYVFIQFGHNDQSVEKGERYAPPPMFRANLARFVTDTRSKGANPVLITPVMRRRFNDKGEFVDMHGEYPDIVRGVAEDLNVPLVDLHRKSEQLIKVYGVEGSKTLYLWVAPGENDNYPKGIEDNTHFSPRGAEMMARLVVMGIREADLDLVKHLK